MITRGACSRSNSAFDCTVSVNNHIVTDATARNVGSLHGRHWNFRTEVIVERANERASERTPLFKFPEPVWYSCYNVREIRALHAIFRKHGKFSGRGTYIVINKLPFYFGFGTQSLGRIRTVLDYQFWLVSFRKQCSVLIFRRGIRRWKNPRVDKRYLVKRYLDKRFTDKSYLDKRYTIKVTPVEGIR